MSARAACRGSRVFGCGHSPSRSHGEFDLHLVAGRMRNSRKSDRCLDTDPTCATPKYVRIGTPFNGRVWALRAHRSPSKGVPLAVCLASLPRPGPAHRDLDVGGSGLRTTRAGEDRSPYSRVLHSGRCDARGQLRVPLTDGRAAPAPGKIRLLRRPDMLKRGCSNACTSPQTTHAMSALDSCATAGRCGTAGSPESSQFSRSVLGDFMRHSKSREALRARRLSVASRLASFTGPGPRGLGGQDGALMGERLNMGRFSDELHDALEELARLAWDAVPGCDGASVSVVQEHSVSTLAATQRRITDIDKAQYRHGDGPCVAAIRDNKAVSVEDYRSERRWPGVAAEASAAGIRSSLSLPLVTSRGQTLGGLNMYGDARAAFGAASRRSAEGFARQATLLLTQLQLLHNERAARAREYEVAATLQRSLLPTLPVLPGITSAARYLVSAEQAQVGGDWYDLFALPDGAIGIAIGDVMGHDLAAAAAMGQLRSVLRSYAYEGSSPSVVLDRLDRLVQGFDMAEVATAIYGRLLLHGGTGMLLFANAGHLPPMVRHQDGTVIRLDRGASPLIGALPPGVARRGEAAELLPAGSLLLLYTDGLVETREHDIDEGIERLCVALAALDPSLGPEQVCDALTAELVASEQDDDVALLAVHIDHPPE